MATNAQTQAIVAPGNHRLDPDNSTQDRVPAPEVVAAIKALRGMFADQASLEFEYQLAREKETW